MAKVVTIPANAVKQEIDLELNKPSERQRVHAIQYDNNKAYIVATVWNNGEQYKLTTDDTIAFVCTKPDGHGINKEAFIDNEGRIIFPIGEQLTVVYGEFPAEFRIFSVTYDDEGKIIPVSKATTSFMVWIEKSSLQNNTVISSDDFDELTKLITEATEVIANANIAIDNAITATSNATNATHEAIVATNNANTATANANTATVNANNAADRANEAANNANIATANAIAATENANEAADRANRAAQDAEDVVAGTGIVMESQKGQANGVASLDSNAKIPVEQLPNYDIKDNTATFTEAENDEDIESGSTLSIIFGRLLKSIKSLRSNKIDKGSIVNNTVTTVEGTVLDGRVGKDLQDQVNELNNNLDDFSSQLAEKPNKAYMSANIKDYGAIGDWGQHPASEKYNSIEELRTIYPLAQSLDDELDLLALEKAVSEFREVYIPYGGYRFNRGIEIGDNKRICGGGKKVTHLIYDGVGNFFTINGNFVSIECLAMSGSFTVGEVGTVNLATAIKYNSKMNTTLRDLQIVGFDTAVDYNVNSYIHNIVNVKIQSCNTGIIGNGEFNNISIRDCNITYCKTGIFVGGGRNIVINSCDIERNDVGVVKTNYGDIIIRDNYFELNSSGNIVIMWGTFAVDMVLIEGNSFYTSGDGEPMIKYHTAPDKHIYILHNNFQCGTLNDGVTIPCLVPTDNTVVKPVFMDNRLESGFTIGVTADKINVNTYYQNGQHVKLVDSYTDVKNALTEVDCSIRFPFVNNGVIELPRFSEMWDSKKAFKIIAFGTVVPDEKMTIDTTNHIVIGEGEIIANQVYTIYFNRVHSDGRDEIIIIKG